MATVTEGEEYKLLKQKSPLMKAAGVFFWVWLALVTCPAVWFIVSHADDIREFAVVAAVGKTNQIVREQYTAFTDRALKEIKVEKYLSKINVPELDIRIPEVNVKIPEVKLDKQMEQVNKAAEKTKKVSSALSKLGVKQAGKVEDTTQALQKQVDKVNQQLQNAEKQIDKINQQIQGAGKQIDKVNQMIHTNIDQVKNTLDKEIQTGLKKEIDSLADSQIRKQMALSEKTYKDLNAEKYGFMTDAERRVTKTIYTELAKNKNGIFKNLIAGMEKYYKWVMVAVLLLVVIVTMIPPVLFKKIAKKLSATFTQCPHCGKIFISKANAANILKLIKWW